MDKSLPQAFLMLVLMTGKYFGGHAYMTPCSKYHMVFLIKSSKRIRNFVDVTNMHTLFKQLDDEMVTFISFCSCRY